MTELPTMAREIQRLLEDLHHEVRETTGVESRSLGEEWMRLDERFQETILAVAAFEADCNSMPNDRQKIRLVSEAGTSSDQLYVAFQELSRQTAPNTALFRIIVLYEARYADIHNHLQKARFDSLGLVHP